ncbi:hypothetical protein QUA46_05030 [Microcoleus sp. MON2_D6]|uniref:hypothetical protein n=1 Tax=unclassified Microcoleus TaxID=2642155 RepID=UPI002FD29928
MPTEANHEVRSIALPKILAFLLGTSSFYPYKFSRTEPSNFCIGGIELLIRLAFTLVVRHDSCTANFRHLGCRSAASNATAEG